MAHYWTVAACNGADSNVTFTRTGFTLSVKAENQSYFKKFIKNIQFAPCFLTTRAILYPVIKLHMISLHVLHSHMIYLKKLKQLTFLSLILS